MTRKLKQIGQKIKALRIGLSMTQVELAEKAGTTQRIVWQIEAGKYKRPGLNLIDRIAKALKIKVAELFI